METFREIRTTLLDAVATQAQTHTFGSGRDIVVRRTTTGVTYTMCVRCKRQIQLLPSGKVTGSALTSECDSRLTWPAKDAPWREKE